MSSLDRLSDDAEWDAFLQYRLDSGNEYDRTLKSIGDFVGRRGYRDICAGIIDGTYQFSMPRKRLVSKMGTSKKRTVYTFREDENIVLKMISHILHEYDGSFSPNLYSYRRDNGIRDAVSKIERMQRKGGMFAYKADISNYFNSIDAERACSELRREMEDADMCELICGLISDPCAMFRGEIVCEPKGAMAGVPISAFLANFYLRDMDRHFHEAGIEYYRYADDIIVFAHSEEEAQSHRDTIQGMVAERGLSINKSKEFFYRPGDSVEFLGFSFTGGTVDISANSVRKLKMRIRVSARSIRRWKVGKGVEDKPALTTMTHKYNDKLLGFADDELSWKHWYFPSINTDASLGEIDAHMQQWLRYIVTGKHNKANYDKVPYEFLKECHYRSLVHEFYVFKEERAADRLMRAQGHMCQDEAHQATIP